MNRGSVLILVKTAVLLFLKTKKQRKTTENIVSKTISMRPGIRVVTELTTAFEEISSMEALCSDKTGSARPLFKRIRGALYKDQHGAPINGIIHFYDPQKSAKTAYLN